MIFSFPVVPQDTVKFVKFGLMDSVRLKISEIPEIRPLSSFPKHSKAISTPAVPITTDTISVCSRNSIADVTFYDSTNFIKTINPAPVNRFLYSIAEQNRIKQAEAKATLVKSLKTGENLPAQPLHYDWIILVILFTAFLYSVVQRTSKNIVTALVRFFLFRRTNDPVSRDTDGLFHWQSTILNLISFLVISLFSYCIGSYYDLIPPGISGVSFWLIALGVLVIVVTFRHIVCVITGNLSGQRDAFREYLVGIYQSYRISAVILFIVVVLMSYTILFPVKTYFITGIIALGLMYITSVIRLLIIFINRNISIFYLILYLCALEILPVVISVKYFTGLV
jgi:hypothetical protein